jgi:Xaa-Pro dipeptidase
MVKEQSVKDYGIVKKVVEGLAQSELDALLLGGLDNVQYISGGLPPFYRARRHQPVFIFLTASGESILVCPAQWASSIRDRCQVKRMATYSWEGKWKSAAVCIEEIIQKESAEGCTIGVDFQDISYKSFETLTPALEGRRILSGDDFIRDQRMVKTAAEIHTLARVAYAVDHGLNGCIHHVTVDRRTTALTLAEELRIHCIEREIDLTGYNACARTIRGDEVRDIWPFYPRYGYSSTHDLMSGETVRLEIQATMDGYWSDSARIMIMHSDPTPGQTEDYGHLANLRDMILKHLAPGALAGEVYETVVSEANSSGIPLLFNLGLGHGIGVNPVEPPFLAKDDPNRISVNMVLVLAPVVDTSEGILWSKDTVVVTAEGCRIVNWYKDWREPYTPIMSI